ncbi:MAG: DUF4313 domain-containing protein [Lachnospiraceae bacterium]|nr:DUF4313 domain-containing protein [Lachnospiraceae bacterium]
MEEKKLMYKIDGQMWQVQLYPVYYTYNRSLGICLCKKGRSIDDEDTLEITRCLDAPQTKNCAYIDVNNYGTDIIKWLEKNKLGKVTGQEVQSGFVTYPEFMFDESILQDYTNEHYAQYLKWQKELNEDQEFLIRSCNMCQKEIPLIVSKKAAAQYREYQQGVPYLIQNIFPELSNGERGLLARGQGMCEKCFKKMFDLF